VQKGRKLKARGWKLEAVRVVVDIGFLFLFREVRLTVPVLDLC